MNFFNKNLLKKKIIIWFLLIIVQVNFIYGVNYAKLKNGLEVFILENHATPLATIELAFRAGSDYQTEETDGIFHLYEHMLFKGNAKYPNVMAIKDALTDMGIADYNGSTAHEFVNYYFTLPSSSLEDGLEFWAAAVQSPNFDETELENEKKVVISEISAILFTKKQYALNELNTKLFAASPYTFSPSGSIDNVDNCKVETLRKIQNDFYCPNNCAIFISGNVDTKKTLKLIEKYYGDWKKNSNNEFLRCINLNCAPKSNLEKNEKYFIAKENFGSTLIINYFGPNTLRNEEDTYKADLFSSYCNSTQSEFYKRIKEIKTENDEEAVNQIGVSYLTTKINGIYSFSFALKSTIQNFAEVIDQIQTIIDEEIAKMSDKNYQYFDEKQIEKLKVYLDDQQILNQENPNVQMEGIRYFWATGNTKYSLTYYDKMNTLKSKDLVSFAEKYLAGKNHVTMFYLNSAYKDQIQDFEKLGYVEIKDKQ
ncbi:MAG: insulinase family protein [Treponemataceae bacterium]|nr:insulinase family protein [Treponemataceae bacterium]